MTTAQDALRVDGLRQLQAKLKSLDGQSQKQLRLVLNDAAEIVIRVARPNIPRRTGAAAASIKARSTQRTAVVQAGSARVPYFGWLDFGGTVGHGHRSARDRKGVARARHAGAIRRPFMKDGRYIYPAYYAAKPEIQAQLIKSLRDLCVSAGLV